MKHLETYNTFLNEGYDDVPLDSIKKKKKLSDYTNYDNKIIIDNYTYLNFKSNDDWYIWGEILVFDNSDETEVANSSYGKETKHSPLNASVDVRSDKRRQGIASNIYKWIEKLTGHTLQPDLPHSKSAEKLWNNPNREFGIKETKYVLENNTIDDKVGKTLWFEYHCFESHDSCDAEIWYRSHQKVEVLEIIEPGAYDTQEERSIQGEPRIYLIKFKDGLKHEVFEDELLNDPSEFERPDPPPRPIK